MQSTLADRLLTAGIKAERWNLASVCYSHSHSKSHFPASAAPRRADASAGVLPPSSRDCRAMPGPQLAVPLGHVEDIG